MRLTTHVNQLITYQQRSFIQSSINEMFPYFFHYFSYFPPDYENNDFFLTSKNLSSANNWQEFNYDVIFSMIPSEIFIVTS